jgi:hypothetical protein
MNVVIKTKYLEEWKKHPRVYKSMCNILFISEPIEMDEPCDMYDVLVRVGYAHSRGEAKRKWNGNKKILDGWVHLSKLGRRKESIYIWKPTKYV